MIGGERDTDTVFRDVIMLALAGFVALVLLMLPHLNPPGEKLLNEIKAPGSVVVEVIWPDELDVDVDLWVQAPGDVPVGYSNKGGRIFNLLRDDLGHNIDQSGQNYEISFSRGMPAGEYTVNLHLYRIHRGSPPIPARVITSTRAQVDDHLRQILVRDVQLMREGQELTVYRFTLDDRGELVPSSVHHIYKPLRSWRPQ